MKQAALRSAAEAIGHAANVHHCFTSVFTWPFSLLYAQTSDVFINGNEKLKQK